ncbi:MAG: hypothetical protein V2J24_04350 [Pseudomonadales bacterium]|jgi:hypothetical protein|nr:hypothetical protein [Pseudomonadales bacterium]
MRYSMLLLATVLSMPAAGAETALRAHLCSGAPSPLDALSRGGRLRLLESLEPARDGWRSDYRPFVVDVTAAEQAAIVDLLGLEVYRGVPFSTRASSAGVDSAGYPAPGSRYCRAEETLAAWARRARLRDEGPLSGLLADAMRRLDAGPSDAAAAEEHVASMTAAVRPLVEALRRPDWSAGLDPWVLRDLASTLTFAARGSEDLATIDAAILARDAAPRDDGLALDDITALSGLRRLAETFAPGRRRVGRLDAGGVLAEEALAELPRFVFVGSTGCRFSRAMLERVAADARLAEAFGQQVLLLAPQTDFRSPGGAPRWNASHPDLAYDAWLLQREWSELALGVTPQLYEFGPDGVRRVLEGFAEDDAEARMGTLRDLLGVDASPRP